VRRPDISKATRILEWKPKVPLEEGLRKSIPHFRERVERLLARQHDAPRSSGAT
jgi:dTDP-glucose 4,6-dehydratase